MSVEMTSDFVLGAETPVITQEFASSHDEYRHLRREAAQDPEKAVALIDFAARQDAALLDRSYALDDGARYILDAVESSKPVSEQVQSLYDELSALAPEFFGPMATHRYDVGDGPFIRQHELDFWWEIATADHADYTISEPNIRQPEPTLEALKNHTPEVPVMLLTRLIGSDNSTAISYLPTAVARDALSLALDFRSPTFKTAVEQGEYSNKIASYARLGRLAEAGGMEHVASIDFLYKSADTEREEYVRTFNRLYESAPGLRAVFPLAFGQTTTDGARGLLANSLFAAKKHLGTDRRTHEAIYLKNGGELPVNFEDDEPLEILRQLDAALRDLQATVNGDSARTVLAAKGDGFQIDRFVNIATGAVSNVNLYTRPTEAVKYDDVYEYGRPGTGVEASISYRIQANSTDQLSPLSKYDRAKEMLSIRLDREHDDVISLDIGSVLGNEDNFGTKVGRLLGWGNALRAAAVGKDAGLNHVKDALDQQYGQPEAFAKLAQHMRVWVEARRITTTELQTYVSVARVGRTAAVNTLELVDAN